MSKNTLCEADIRLENFQKNIHTTYQQQNLNRGIRAIKNPSAMKNTKMIGNYLVNSGKALKKEPVLVWKILEQ